MTAIGRWVGSAGFVALALGLGASTSAQPFRVQALLQPDHGITESQNVRLVIQIEGTTNAPVAPPALEGLVNLERVGGPSQSLNSVWNNGRFATTMRFVYTLLPRAPGPAEIPAVTVEIDGQSYRTQTIRFEVGKAPAGTAAPQDRGRPRAGNEGDRAEVFLREKIGATEVWLGEPVAFTLELATAEQIADSPTMISSPSLSGFWVEDVALDPNAEAYKSVIDGRQYVVYPLLRKVLVPQTSGELEIEPFVQQIAVRRRSSGDPFDFFSIGRVQTVVRKTQPIKLRVKPLPADGRPADFSGAVGSFDMEVTIDRQEALVNDAVALKATVNGTGFLQAVAAPAVAGSSDLKVFDPKIAASASVNQGKLVSSKSWEWILVPLAPGELNLPELRFSYFDPASASYRVLRQKPTPLLVKRGSAPQGEGVAAHGDIQLQRRDLAFIKLRRGQLLETSGRVHHQGPYLALLFSPLVWVPLFVLAGRHRERLRQNRGLARARRARTRARKRMAGVRKHLQSPETTGFHENVARALVEYVADRFDRSAAGLTYEQADELLASRGIDLESRRRFRACLETCDFARFVPAAGAAERRSELLDEAEQIIEQIERAW